MINKYRCLKCNNTNLYESAGVVVCSNPSCNTVHEIDSEGKLKLPKQQPKIIPLNPEKFNARDTVTHELTPNLVTTYGKDNLNKFRVSSSQKEFSRSSLAALVIWIPVIM